MNKKFKLEKVLELREKALEREKITLADLQLKEKQAYEEMYAVMEDIKAKNIELEQDRAKGIFDFIEMYNKRWNERGRTNAGTAKCFRKSPVQ